MSWPLAHHTTAEVPKAFSNEQGRQEMLDSKQRFAAMHDTEAATWLIGAGLVGLASLVESSGSRRLVLRLLLPFLELGR